MRARVRVRVGEGESEGDGEGEHLRLRLEGVVVREEALLHAHHEHLVELETLGRVHRHQAHVRPGIRLLVGLGIGIGLGLGRG